MTTMIDRDDRGGFRRVTGPIEIGDDCWVATDCTVLPGSVIPEGVVVGARSLIEGELEPWTITSGSPATVRGQRAKWEPTPIASNGADARA
jgi:acetyltransferase-like isoleucine patch superfamily enzyme